MKCYYNTMSGIQISELRFNDFEDFYRRIPIIVGLRSVQNSNLSTFLLGTVFQEDLTFDYRKYFLPTLDIKSSLDNSIFEIFRNFQEIFSEFKLFTEAQSLILVVKLNFGT